ELGEELPTIDADATQINQVIMNLVTNAVEAIGDQPGTIQVRSEVLDVSAEMLRRTYFSQGVEPGPYVCLTVQDTGCGMDPETLSRIFDPFFTTKFAGRGLGLGSVLGIVRAHRA